MSILSAFKSLQHRPSVVRAEHTVWQAAAGAFIAALAGTHGDVRVAVTAAVAGALAGLRTLVFPGAAAPAPAIVVAAPLALPAAPVDVVSTPSTPASAPPAAP